MRLPDGKSEDEIQRKLRFIHALVKHLLHVDDKQEIFVGVTPLSDAWAVKVSYSGFSLEKVSPQLSEAIDAVLSELTTVVSLHMQAGVELLKQAPET